jgi:DNA (cytosine-5)-methyltransferase 1
MRKLTHGSLFSGIGGFDLAAQWMGWENKFHCEWNDFGQKVLHHYWPNAESFTDITKTDFTKYYGTVDIITGGFPCQPYSSAGKRKGKEDERHLWPQMLRAIREVSPRYVVGENVRGLTNWNGGLVFEEVCAELESYGYQVAPVIIPACAVNAPHRRERIWFVAYAPGIRKNTTQPGSVRSENAETNRQRIYTFYDGTAPDGDQRVTTHSECLGLGNCATAGQISGEEKNANGERYKSTLLTQANDYGYKSDWDNFPTQSPVCRGNDGLPGELDGIAISKWRNETIKAYGNAIVPQVAYQIFKAIEKTLYL